jgi:Zn-dependent M28 family amino/carboxypeptidase
MADRDPDPARQGEPVPGANDGASGVAVLLEVAEALAKRPPKVAIHLVFFDAEDLGAALAPQEFCLGSKLYASKLPPAGDPSRPRAAVLFDLVGDRDLNIHPERNSAERAANLVAIIGTAAKATGAKRFHDDPKYPVTDDHLPLLDAGIPAADVIDLDYDAWHTTRDLPDRVSAESLAEVSRVAIWLATRSAFSRP